MTMVHSNEIESNSVPLFCAENHYLCFFLPKSHLMHVMFLQCVSVQ